MNDAAREMTLAEWVDRLPPNHSARKEYAALREQPEARVQGVSATQAAQELSARLAEDRAILDDIRDAMGGGPYDTLATRIRKMQPEVRGVVDDVTRDATRWRKLIANTKTDHIWHFVLSEEHKEGHNHFLDAIDALPLTTAQQPAQEGGGEVCDCGATCRDDGQGRCRYTAPPSAPVGVEVTSLPALWRLREDNGEERTEYDRGYEQASDECADALERALTQQPAQAAPGWKLVGQTRVPTGERPRTPGDDPLGPPVITEWETHYRWEETISRVTKTPTPPGDDAAGGGS